MTDRLTLAGAEAIAGSALNAARAVGVRATVAVVDAGGHLMALRRDDGAGFIGVEIARMKAWTAAASGMTTARWNELASAPAVAPIVAADGVMAVAGGRPLWSGDVLIGAVGVSGGSPNRTIIWRRSPPAADLSAACRPRSRSSARPSPRR